MKTINLRFTSYLLLSIVFFLSSIFIYSCKSTEDIKGIGGPGVTDSDLSQKIPVTTVSLKVPLSDLEEDKYQIMVGGYSTVVLPLESNYSQSSNCTTREEIEEMFENDSGRLSDISLNSACTPGYKITVNLFCKTTYSSSKTKCYSGSIEISSSQLKSSSKLNLNLELYKTIVIVDGPDSIPVTGELINETLSVQLIGVLDMSSDSTEQVEGIKAKEEKTTTSSSEQLNINYFMNTACLTSIFKNFKYSQKTCNAAPLRVNSSFTLECNYYKDSTMLYPATAKFKSVSIDGNVYYPVNTKELTNIIYGLKDKMTITCAIINNLNQETGVQFTCTWSRKK